MFQIEISIKLNITLYRYKINAFSQQNKIFFLKTRHCMRQMIFPNFCFDNKSYK